MHKHEKGEECGEHRPRGRLVIERSVEEDAAASASLWLRLEPMQAKDKQAVRVVHFLLPRGHTDVEKTIF